MALQAATMVQTGQNFFYYTFWVPAVVYYFFDPDSDRRFPATISHTIRCGPAKWTHHALWLSGWACVLTGMRLAGEALLWQAFAWQMVLTGVAAIVVFPVGESALGNAVHYAASLAYMVDHAPMMVRWEMTWPHQTGFYASLFLFLLVTASMRWLKVSHGLTHDGVRDGDDGTSTTDLRRYCERHSTPRTRKCGGVASDAKTVATVEARKRTIRKIARPLWFLELAEMALENLLFLFFVAGMPQ